MPSRVQSIVRSTGGSPATPTAMRAAFPGTAWWTWLREVPVVSELRFEGLRSPSGTAAEVRPSKAGWETARRHLLARWPLMDSSQGPLTWPQRRTRCVLAAHALWNRAATAPASDQSPPANTATEGVTSSCCQSVTHALSCAGISNAGDRAPHRSRGFRLPRVGDPRRLRRSADLRPRRRVDRS